MILPKAGPVVWNAQHARQASGAGWLPSVAKIAGGLNASWITRSEPLACSMNHLFGDLSPPKITLRPAYSRMKLTGPSPAWMAGMERTVTPFS